jgi:hypothetical protein
MIPMLFMVLAPILILGALAALAFIGVHLYTYGWLWLDGVRLRRSLAKQGRTLELREASENIRRNEGMVIVDAPTLGWNVSRVWWSPVVDFVPRPDSWQNDRLCPPEDLLNYKRFIDPSSGLAKLVDGFVFTQRVRTFLRDNFGVSACCFVHSGAVLTEERRKTARAKPGASPTGGPAERLGSSGVGGGPPSAS